jgi:hypothetical protein
MTYKKIIADSVISSSLAGRAKRDFFDKYFYNIMIEKYEKSINNRLHLIN